MLSLTDEPELARWGRVGESSAFLTEKQLGQKHSFLQGPVSKGALPF